MPHPGTRVLAPGDAYGIGTDLGLHRIPAGTRTPFGRTGEAGEIDSPCVELDEDHGVVRRHFEGFTFEEVDVAEVGNLQLPPAEELAS